MKIFFNQQVQLLLFIATLVARTLYVNSAIITSVNYVFEGFSPYSMVRFFEFNDRGWNISDNCLKDTYNYLEGLRKGSIWAIKLYDATSYYSGGAYSGNNYRIHNPQLCRNLQLEYKDMLGMHWNLRLNTTVVPFPVTIILAKYAIEMSSSHFYKSKRIHQMICLPKSCKDPDLLQILDIFMFQSNHIVKNISYIEHRIVKENFDVFQDGGFYTIVFIIGTSLLMFTLSHFSNYCPIMEEPKQANAKPGRLDTKFNIIEEYEKLRKSVNLNVNQFADRTPVHSATFTLSPGLHSAVGLDILENGNTAGKNIPKPTFLHDISSAVSLQNVIFELLKREHDAQTAMNGILAVFTILLIYANTCAEMDFISNNKDSFEREDTSFRQFIRKQTTYLFDAYFFISGSNLTYTFFKVVPKGNCNVLEQLVHLLTIIANKICRNNSKTTESGNNISTASGLATRFLKFGALLEIVNINFIYCMGLFTYACVWGFYLPFIRQFNALFCVFSTDSTVKFKIIEGYLSRHNSAMVQHKDENISLSYAFVLIVLELSSKYFHYNTVLEVPSFDFERCELNKWRNIVYIEIFLPLEERCMPWTWFISIEIQFFAAGCLLLLLAQIHPKYAAIICSAVFTTSIVASTFLEMNQYGLDEISNNSIVNELTEFNLIYDKVWLRIPLYILGMCLGYILQKTNGTIQIRVTIFTFGWIACLLMMCFFLFGYQFTLFRASQLTRACVITLGHTMWTLVIFWIILASTTQYGVFLRNIFSNEFMNIIGKLSNASLIIGPFVIRTFLLAGEVPLNTTEGQVFIMFIGFSAIIYILALVLFIFFDSPLKQILCVVTKRNAKEKIEH